MFDGFFAFIVILWMIVSCLFVYEVSNHIEVTIKKDCAECSQSIHNDFVNFFRIPTRFFDE